MNNLQVYDKGDSVECRGEEEGREKEGEKEKGLPSPPAPCTLQSLKFNFLDLFEWRNNSCVEFTNKVPSVFVICKVACVGANKTI